MEHVMVPVPEEHFLEFRQAMLRIGLGQVGWDADEVRRVVPMLDARSVDVLVPVARSSLEHVALPYRHVAAEVGIGVGEVLDIVTEVNDTFRRESLPLPLITDTRTQHEADGSVSATPTLVMVAAAAAMVLEAAGDRGRPVDDQASVTNL